MEWQGIVMLLVFGLSGIAGLIYQSIWSHYLGLYLGHAAYAQCLVLAIYMGGMALGAWSVSRYCLGGSNLLRAYALVELAVGVTALVFHEEYAGLQWLAYDVAFPALRGSWAVHLFKWMSGALLILPQAVLLGMTFPLMTGGLLRKLAAGSGRILGGLYFINSAGAAVGALLATFVLLPAVGLPGAMQVGAALNIVVAIVAFLVAGPALAGSTTSDFASLHRHDERVGANSAKLLLFAAFITGATSFVYEIGWVRMLSLALGSTVHAFELMLAAFIGGLACGGWWIHRRLDFYSRLLRVGGWVQLFMGLAALASLLVYDRSFDWVAWFMHALSRSEEGYTLYNGVTALVALLIMAPAAFFAGMTLPVFTLALLRSGGGEKSVGHIYAANTVGAIVGVFAALHLLVPVLGLKLAMTAAAAGDLVLGLVLLLRERDASGRIDQAFVGATATAAFSLIVVLLFAHFDPSAMAAGVYRHGAARIPPDEGKVLYYRDGKTASVAVFASRDGVVSIATNGKVDAGIQLRENAPPSADEVTMVMAAELPLLYHPDPKSAAVIGFGSGLSTHTLLGDPRLERVDTIEIEPAMVGGARAFGERVQRAYEDPRSHIHIEDAKTYFAAQQDRYDIILSEPSNPWVSGVASLFSREFYRFVPRYLKPGGLFVQWVQLYETNDDLIGTVVHALSESFSDYEAYLTDNGNLLIVARADGALGDIRSDILNSPTLAPLFARVGLGTNVDIAMHRVGDYHSLAPWFDMVSHRTNSDFFPILSLEAPRARFINSAALGISRLSTADIPYLEVLAAQPPRIDVASNKYYSYPSYARRAVVIANSLRSGPDVALADLPSAEDAALLAQLREVLGHCRGGTPDIAAQEALLSAATATIPYLDPAALDGVWINPKWITCATQATNVRGLLKVVTALASRDWPEVRSKAVALLGDASQMGLAPSVRDWLLRSAMLGAISMHDYAAVAELDAGLGKDVDAQAATLPYRSYLLAYAAWQASTAQRPEQ